MGHRPVEFKLLKILVERILRSRVILGKHAGQVRQSTDVAGLASNMLRGMSAATARLSAPLLSGSRHRRYVMPFQVVRHGFGRFILVGRLTRSPFEPARDRLALCGRPTFCQ